MLYLFYRPQQVYRNFQYRKVCSPAFTLKLYLYCPLSLQGDKGPICKGRSRVLGSPLHCPHCHLGGVLFYSRCLCSTSSNQVFFLRLTLLGVKLVSAQLFLTNFQGSISGDLWNSCCTWYLSTWWDIVESIECSTEYFDQLKWDVFLNCEMLRSGLAWWSPLCSGGWATRSCSSQRIEIRFKLHLIINLSQCYLTFFFFSGCWVWKCQTLMVLKDVTSVLMFFRGMTLHRKMQHLSYEQYTDS